MAALSDKRLEALATEEQEAERAIARAKAICQRNMPDPRAPLQWKKLSESVIASTCGRYRIARHGEGVTERFSAYLFPNAVLGERLITVQEAKDICGRHASPLPLEPL